MRLFIGLPLASEVQKELSEAVARLKTPQDGLKWTAPESWHITLQFLGNTDQQRFQCVLARLAEVHSAPVKVSLGELKFFDHAGVFFAEVLPSADLVALSQAVTMATGQCGFLAESRPYHPHITLARSKGQGRSRPRGALPLPVDRTQFTGFMATEFLLYESYTKPEGAQYVVRGRFRLDVASPFDAEGRKPSR